MERNIFPHPAVAGELKKRFLEARLHLDGREPARSRNNELRKTLAGTLARPTYVIMDPKTRKVLRKHEGWLPDPQGFLNFLKGS